MGTWLDVEDPGFTDLGYTGQRNYAGFGLMDYNARFYSPSLGKFTQPDTIIPDLTNTQSWNRYSYVRNSPINYNDPTGHVEDGACNGSANDCGKHTVPTPQERLEKLLNEYDIEYTYNGGTKLDKYRFDRAMLEMFDRTSENFASNYMRGMRFTVNRDVGGDYWGISDWDNDTITLGDKYDPATLNHEIWHAIDDNSGGTLSSDFEKYVGASTLELKKFNGDVSLRFYFTGMDTPPSYGGLDEKPPNRQEDFAESGEEFFGHGNVKIGPSDLRWKFFTTLTTPGNGPR